MQEPVVNAEPSFSSRYLQAAFSPIRKLFPRQFDRISQRLKGPIAARFARGAFWSLVGSVLSRFLALGAAIAAARILGKAEYGQFGIIQASIGMFATVAGFGMGTTASKFVAEFRQTDPARAARIIALTRIVSWVAGVGLCAAMAILARTIAANIKAPHLTEDLQVGSLLILFGAISGAQTGVLSGLEAFKQIARINTIGALLSFPLIVGGAWFSGLFGLVSGMVAAQGALCALGWYTLRRQLIAHGILETWRGWRDELPVLWKFSIPAVAGGLIMPPVTWAASTILVNRPGGFEHMGAFNAANQWFNALLWLPYVLAQALLPILSERVAAADRSRSGKLLIASIWANAIVSLPVVLMGSVLSPYIMRAYGKDFAGEWPTLIIVLLTAGIASIQIPVGNSLAASGRMWLGFAMNAAWSIVFVCATWVFLPWGSFGFASARLLAYITQGLWAISYSIVMLRRLKKGDADLAST